MLSNACIAQEILGISSEECLGPNEELSKAIGQAACGQCLRTCFQVLRVQALQATRLQKANESLQHAARTDHLTKLLNRRGFDQELVSRVKNSRPFALLMIDLKNFGEVNKREGHLGGDLMLVDAAAHLLQATRGTDGVASRFGGDELGVFLSLRHHDDEGVMGIEEVKEIARRIKEGYVNRPEVMEYNNRYATDQLGMRIGYGIWEPGMVTEDFIMRIDPKGPFAPPDA